MLKFGIVARKYDNPLHFYVIYFALEIRLQSINVYNAHVSVYRVFNMYKHAGFYAVGSGGIQSSTVFGHFIVLLSFKMD